MIIDAKGRRWTSSDVEDWYFRIVTNPGLAQKYWQYLRAIDSAPGRAHIDLGLIWCACINNRDQVMESERWDKLSDKIKVLVMWVDDEDIEMLTRLTIHEVVTWVDDHWEDERAWT